MTWEQGVFKRYHSDKHFSQFFPTRRRQKSTGIDADQNCIAVALCILFRYLRCLMSVDGVCVQSDLKWLLLLCFPCCRALPCCRLKPPRLVAARPPEHDSPGGGGGGGGGGCGGGRAGGGGVLLLTPRMRYSGQAGSCRGPPVDRTNRIKSPAVTSENFEPEIGVKLSRHRNQDR